MKLNKLLVRVLHKKRVSGNENNKLMGQEPAKSKEESFNNKKTSEILSIIKPFSTSEIVYW